MLEKEKKKIQIPKRIFPIFPKECSKALRVMRTPLVDDNSSGERDMRITRAVMVQTTIVSIKGPSMATSPSEIGSAVFAFPWAMGAVPIPASLEKAAL
jgi:hypothetical protein